MNIEPGLSFGRLTVVRFSHSKDGRVWLCSCTCGSEVLRHSSQIGRDIRLERGSCGCTRSTSKEVSPGLFRCSICKEAKPASAFNRSAHAEQGIVAACTSCSANVRAARSDVLLPRKRENYHRTKHLHAHKRKAYRDNNREKANRRSEEWRARNPQKRRQVANDWVSRNKAYGAFKSSLRRALMLRITPLWADLEKIKNIYAEASRAQMEVDHIIPINSALVCGLHCEANLQLLSKTDNLKKSNRYWPDMP